MLPWSVTATVSIPSSRTRGNRSFTRIAPSSRLYWVWTCRCVNSPIEGRVLADRSDVEPGPWHTPARMLAVAPVAWRSIAACALLAAAALALGGHTRAPAHRYTITSGTGFGLFGFWLAADGPTLATPDWEGA